MPSGSSQQFVHLHNHTEYSMLDGAARVGDLFEEAARMGMPALATTDHGYVFGAYEFWKQSQKHGVKPIIGVEAYVTPGTHRTDRTRVTYGDGGRDDVSSRGLYTHMTLLAENNGGMHNLFRMSSQASLDAVYGKFPRLDRELLADLQRRPDRHHRLRQRRGADPAPAGPVRQGARGRGRPARHLRARATTSPR